MAKINVSSDYILSRLDKIEHRQKIMSQYLAKLKLQLDMLQSQFQTTDQLEEWEGLKEQVSDIQQRFNGLLTFSSSTSSLADSPDTMERSDEVIIEQFLDEVAQEFGSQEQEAEDKALEERTRVFTDFEFKMERAMMITNRFYSSQ